MLNVRTHRIPPRCRRKSIGAASRIGPARDIVERLRVGIEERIEPAQALLARTQELVVQQRNGGSEDRARSTRATDEVIATLPCDDDVCGLRGHVWETATAAVVLARILATYAAEVRTDGVRLKVGS